MKSFKILALSAAVMLSLSACGDEPQPAQDPAKADAPAAKQEAPAAKPAAKIAPMNEDEIVAFLKDNIDKGSEYYTQAIQQFQFCDVDDGDKQFKSSKCPAMKAVYKIFKDKELAAKLATHTDGIIAAAKDADPRVRIGAFIVIEKQRIKDAEKSSEYKTLAGVLDKETDPAVIVNGLKSVNSYIDDMPELWAVVKKHASHENPDVRFEVARTIGDCGPASCRIYQLDGAKDILTKLVNDADLDVAVMAAQAAGEVRDEDYIDTIAGKLTAAAGTKDAEKYSFAATGLTAYWTGSPWFKKTSEKAYKAWFDYVTKVTPAADFDTPSFVSVSIDFKKNRGNEALMSAPWYKEAEIIEFLRKVATDKNYPFLTRGNAITSLISTGDKAMLEALKADLTAMPEETFKKSYIDKVEKALAKM